MEEQIIDGFNLSLSLKKCLMAFVLVLVSFVFIPWQFRLPIAGELILKPSVCNMLAPRAGVLDNLSIKEGQLVHKGQELYVLEPSQGLMYTTYYQQKLQHILQKLKQETAERNYQRQRLIKFKTLLSRQILSQENYHEFESNLRQIEVARQSTLDRLAELRRQQRIRVQAPISGSIVGLHLENKQYLRKDQMIFTIQPIEKQWLLKFKLPLTHLTKAYQGAALHLSVPYLDQVKRYSIHAEVMHIGKSIHTNQGQAFVMVFAKIVNPRTDFLVKMPLHGYLVGVSRTWLSWLMQSIFRD